MSVLQYLNESLVDDTDETTDPQTDSVMVGIKKFGMRIDKMSDGRPFTFLYHGTSKANNTKILKSGVLNAGTFFSHDDEVSRRYAKMTQTNKPTLMYLPVAIDGLIFDGNYFVARNKLKRNQNGIYEGA